MSVVNEVLRLANVQSDDVIYDLGSGDGRIVISTAQQYGTRGIGVDIDPQRIQEASENAQKSEVSIAFSFFSKICLRQTLGMQPLSPFTYCPNST